MCWCLCLWNRQIERSHVRYIHMFVCKTCPWCSLVKCQCPLPSVTPTGSFKEVRPCPPPWHLQLLSSHLFVPPPPGSKSRHPSSTKKLFKCVFSTTDRIWKPLSNYCISVAKDQLCRIEGIPDIYALTTFWSQLSERLLFNITQRRCRLGYVQIFMSNVFLLKNRKRNWFI